MIAVAVVRGQRQGLHSGMSDDGGIEDDSVTSAFSTNKQVHLSSIVFIDLIDIIINEPQFILCSTSSENHP